MYSTRILALKDVEPGIGFYVYANSDTKVKIVTNKIGTVCQEYVENKKYANLIDSGIDDDFAHDNSRAIKFKSRYLPHYRRGVYDDSRVMFIYPKLKTTKTESYTYAPAIPKSQIEYTKEYEGVEFYMYDYKYKKCYVGNFPSKQIPPFATLRVVK